MKLDYFNTLRPNTILPALHIIFVEPLHSAVFFSVSITHSIVDEMLFLNSCPTLQLYVTFELGSHGVAAVELFLPLATIGKSPQCSTIICNIDISVSSVITST